MVYIIIWFRLCKCFLIKGFQRGRRFESLSAFSMHLDSISRIQELLKTLNGFLKWEPYQVPLEAPCLGHPTTPQPCALCSGCAGLQWNCVTFAKSLMSGMDMCWSLSHCSTYCSLIVSKWSKENRTQSLSPLQSGMSVDSSRADFAQGRLPKKDPSEGFLSIPAQN